MNDILLNNNINGPIKYLFSRSPEVKKNNKSNYNMSASVPNIKIVTDDSNKSVVKLDSNVRIDDINVVRKKDKDKDKDKDSDVNSVSSGSTVEASPAKPSQIKKPKTKLSNLKSKFNADDYQNFVNNSKTKERRRKHESDDSESESESDSESGSESNSESGSDDYSDTSSQSSRGSKAKVNSKHEKQQILMKLVDLERRGIELTKKYSMSSKLEELKFELKLHESSAELEASIKMQQNFLIAAVTGLEYANTKFDPIGAKLDGWSESVTDNIDDYHDIFVKLHEKYKHRADLPPELQLLVTLVGGAFMFHVTKTMFSSAMPRGLNNNQESEIMKNISAAMSNPPPPRVANVSTSEISGPSLNLSHVFNNRSDDASSVGTIETSKEVTINQKGKRAINL